MRRAAIATATAAGLALAWWHPWAPPPEPVRVFLPHASQRQPAPPAPIVRPASPAALADAVARAGALVVPRPGTYRLPRRAYVASGVTLNGRGRVTVTGHGFIVQDARGVTFRDLSIIGVSGDAIEAKRSAFTGEGLELARASDGLLDAYGGSLVTLRDSLLRDNVRGITLGNWQAPGDGREHLTLERVRFERVRVRTPKAQDADVIARGLVVVDAVEWPVDARGSSTVVLEGFEWSGRKINPPGWRADAGSIVEVTE